VKFETLEYFFERGRLADVLPASFARFAAPIVVETETLQHGELVGKDELTEHVRGNPDGFLGFPKPPEMFLGKLQAPREGITIDSNGTKMKLVQVAIKILKHRLIMVGGVIPDHIVLVEGLAK
jgi:hypothetical protein